MYEALNNRRKATAEQGIKLIAGFDMMTKKNGLIQPVKILFSQPETYVLYKEMMLRMGNSIAQLKPVTVIGNEQQKNFFFTLVDDFEEIKALCAR